MFVKSQNRTTLVDVNCVYVANIDGVENAIIARKDNCRLLLGEYKSHHRALEVLDMIQDAIEDGATCHEKTLIDGNGTTQSWKRNCVFEMPLK